MTHKSGVAGWFGMWFLPVVVGVIALLAHGWSTFLWLHLNPFPDGSQNEYFHVGNAYDLWSALSTADVWHLRYYTAHSYWPPGLAIAAWPIFALFGASHGALVAMNFFWLALAFVGVAGLARTPRRAAVAIALLALCPGVFGPLVRFEPNIAQLATTALALWMLDRDGLSSRRGALALGCLLGVGLMTDRLGTLPLVLGALGWGVWCKRDRPETWRGLAWAALPVLLIAGSWYLQWSQHQLAEVGSQLGMGEIDAAGHRTEGTTPFSIWTFFYYPLTLLDAQAGVVLGAGMLAALCWRARRDLTWTVLVGWLLFTLVQKKQVFYTLPLLAPLVVVVSDAIERLPKRLQRGGLALLILIGLHQVGGRQWGAGWPVQTPLGVAAPLPDAWVGPRHVLARGPTHVGFPFDAVKSAIGETGAVVIFSDARPFYEGYVELGLRAEDLSRRVITVRGNPLGVYEDFRQAHAFVVISDSSEWPSEGALVGALVRDHYALRELPPVTELIAADAIHWNVVLEWSLSTGHVLTVWSRSAS